MEQMYYQVARAYFRGTISAADEVQLSSWLGESEANRVLFRQWEEEWRKSAKAEASAKTQAAWEKMKLTEQKPLTLKEQRPLTTFTERTKAQALTIRRRYYAAAAVALLVIVSGLVWLMHPQQETVIARTGAHETQELLLPDGTQVTLNSLSSLAYAGNFNGTDRQILFEGEAVFHVAKDDERPFVIHVGDYNVTVLGTTFNLSAYPNDDNYSLALIEGKVCVAYLTDTTYVLPDEQVRFDVETHHFDKQPYNASQAAAWTNSRLEGEFALGELTHKLERIYDVRMAFNEAHLAREKVYISVGYDESFSDVCDALQTLLPVRIELRDKRYVISAQ